MSVVFNHGIRHDICDRNPIQLVRQSAKRKAAPAILSASEVQRLIAVLGIRERTLVLLAFGTGLRMSELFGSNGTMSTFVGNKSASHGPSCSKSWALARRRHPRNLYRSILAWQTLSSCGVIKQSTATQKIGYLQAQQRED